MKNQLLSEQITVIQVTSLVMGSLMVFSGQALTMKSNNQEVNNAEVLGEVEVLIAQQGEKIISEEQKDIVVQCLNQLLSNLRDFKTKIEKRIESGKSTTILLRAFNQAEIIVGDALALIDVEILTKERLDLVFDLLNSAITKLDNAESNLQASPTLLPDEIFAIEAINSAQTSLGDCLATTGPAFEPAE